MPETFEWNRTEDPERPNWDQEVLIQTDKADRYLAYWRADANTWDAPEIGFVHDKVMAWAYIPMYLPDGYVVPAKPPASPPWAHSPVPV